MLKTSTGNTVNAVSDRKKNCSGDKISKTIKSKSAFSRTDFLTPKARLAFTQLRQAFTKAPIFQYFDLKYDIWIETNASRYAIGGVLSQLTTETGQ